MNEKYFRVIASSVLLSSLLLIPALEAQAKNFDYNFCIRNANTPNQRLTNSIAQFLNSRYQGGVKTLYPVCSGPNPNRGNQTTWVYRAKFYTNNVLDVAIVEGQRGLQISTKNRGQWSSWSSL